MAQGQFNMADMMIPILFIVLMLIIIECMESPLFLMMLGILFMPVGLVFYSTGNYDTLFQAPLTYEPYLRWMIGAMLSCVSIAAFLRLAFIRRGFHEAVKET